MNNLVASAKKFLKNKNIVTIAGVVIILILLYIGYSTQINNAVEPVQIPVATQTIQPRTEITDDMVQIIDMPNVSLSDNVIRSKSQIVGKYSNVNSVIPEGSMFYTDTVISGDELPDAAFAKVKAGEVVYNFPVDMESTYGNSIFPGNYIDLYYAANDETGKLLLGKLIESIEVLAVKDANGNHVFENSAELNAPSSLIFAVPEELHLLLRKASYLSGEIIPVPRNRDYSQNPGATVVSSEYIQDFILSQTVIIPDQQLPSLDDNLEENVNPNVE